MAKLILNIRPFDDSVRDAASLERRGVASLVMPLLKINSLAFTAPDYHQATGLIFTSRHAVTAFSDNVDMALWRKNKIFVVGHGTAALAQRAGFKSIIVGTGGGAGLVPEIINHAAPGSRLIWPAGVDKSFDMVNAARRHNIEVTPVDVYEAETLLVPEPDAIRQIAEGAVLGVVVMSARTARYLNEVFSQQRLDNQKGAITLIAGSQNIADCAGSGWYHIFVAKRPRRSRLLAIATMLYHRDGESNAAEGR